jgi:hypothetical protein
MRGDRLLTRKNGMEDARCTAGANDSFLYHHEAAKMERGGFDSSMVSSKGADMMYTKESRGVLQG